MFRRSSAFSPCNITGFFEIHRDETDPLKIGSTGVSIAIDQGVTTLVSVQRTQKPKIHVTFNGRPLTDESVSSYVARKYTMLAGVALDLRIIHHCQLPTGCGFGTSGAGALSLSYALNDALNLSLSNVEVAQMAHVSEIACGTGLGTVASVFQGGMTLRATPGAPGEGKVRSIHTPPSLRVLTFSFGPLATRRVLGNEQLRQRVNKCGVGLLDEFNPKEPVASFISISRRFASCLGLASPRLSSMIRKLESLGLEASMMMLGESLFTLIPNSESLPRRAFLRRWIPPVKMSSITGTGAHLI